MKSLPPDHPFYTRGWVVGQTVSGTTPVSRRKTDTSPSTTKLPDAAVETPMSEQGGTPPNQSFAKKDAP